MSTLEAAIAAVVGGDLDGFPTILAAKHPDLLDAAKKLPPLIISRAALIRVLKVWQEGGCSADDVQRWSSFVRRGYVAGKVEGKICPIDISYDSNDEELIVEVIGRFDQIGDKVDGTIDHDEQKEMLEALEGCHG